MAVQRGFAPGRVSIVPVGEDVLLPLRDGLEEVLDLDVRLGRGQYMSTALLQVLRPTTSGELLLGVADVDLYARSMNFVFG